MLATLLRVAEGQQLRIASVMPPAHQAALCMHAGARLAKEAFAPGLAGEELSIGASRWSIVRTSVLPRARGIARLELRAAELHFALKMYKTVSEALKAGSSSCQP